MFPHPRNTDNSNRKLFFNITKFACLSPPSSDLSQNTLIRRDQLSDLFHPNEPIYVVFTRQFIDSKYVYGIQGFGSIVMSVDIQGSNKYLSPPGFIHYDPRCSKEQGCLHGNDNGYCAALGTSLVNCNEKMNTAPRCNTADEKTGLTVVEGPISLLKMVNLDCQTVLEYPLVQSISIDNTLGLLVQQPSVSNQVNLVQLTNGQSLIGNQVQLGNIFQVGATLSNNTTVTMNEPVDDHSSSSSSMSLTSYSSDGYNDIVVSNGNFQSTLGLSQSAPEIGIPQQIPQFVQCYPTLYSNALTVPEQNVFQGQVPAPLLQYQQPDAQLNYNMNQYTTHQNAVVEYQQNPYLLQQPNIPCQQTLLLDLPNQNHGYASTADLANLAPVGAVCGDNGMLLQVCTEPDPINMGFILPPKETDSVNICSDVPPPAPPLEILGGSCSGNVASRVDWNGVGEKSPGGNFSGQNNKKSIGEIEHRNRKRVTPRHSPRGFPYYGHAPLRRHRRVNRTSSEGVEMLGYMNNKQSNPTSSFASSTITTSGEQQQAEQAGGGEIDEASTSTESGGSGESSGSSVASTCTTPLPVQQYVLGCANPLESLDPENITIKMLLETPYSPRTKSSRNFELDEYQKITAEDELQRRINELCILDMERAKYGRGTDDYEFSGFEDANQIIQKDYNLNF